MNTMAGSTDRTSPVTFRRVTVSQSMLRSRSSRQTYSAPSILALFAASPLRMRLISRAEYCVVPQSPGAIVAMTTSAPFFFSLDSVPVQQNSTSSGCAPIARTLLFSLMLLSLCSETQDR